ncbi:hypothetical protein CEXT_564571 [Caerostris extrusa]|uniref:Uncharacterized protein n=1 Tax=Caerostris extrusa TaxID=172846 RepID=A0AAV4R7G6_CAEEX|nr:hypothetical protein CEXT_564571 [Caerostris extrusa]
MPNGKLLGLINPLIKHPRIGTGKVPSKDRSYNTELIFSNSNGRRSYPKRRLAKQKAEIIEGWREVEEKSPPIQNNCFHSAAVNKAIRRSDVLEMLSASNEELIVLEEIDCFR